MSTPGRPVFRLPLIDTDRFGLQARVMRSVDRSEKPLQVGDLARTTGKTVRAIHHYEEVGLLKPDARSKGRFRLYDASAVTRVRWIGKLSDLGMSLAQIKTVVEAWEGAPTASRAMVEVRATYRAKLEETRAQIEHLVALEAELQASIDYLDTCEDCDDPVPAHSTNPEDTHDHPAHLTSNSVTSNSVTCGACQLREREAEPELVAGIR